MKKRFSEVPIVSLLREGETGGKTVEQICRDHGVLQPTYYLWKRTGPTNPTSAVAVENHTPRRAPVDGPAPPSQLASPQRCKSTWLTQTMWV